MIRFDDMELRRGGQVLIGGASFGIHPGWRVGLTGANGCGKSSLLAALRGELAPDAGRIEMPRGWVCAHLPQEVEASPRRAVDYVLDGDAALRALQERLEHCQDGTERGRLYAEIDAIDGWSAEARARQLLAGLGFAPGDPDRTVAEFSGGWRMRLGLARTLMTRSDLLLLDEPTNHLDFEAILWLEGWLMRYSGTLIVIAHDRRFLDSVVSHIAHIEHRQIQLYTGNYSAAERRRAEAVAQTEAAARRVAEERAHLERFIARFRAKATKARQAQSRLKRLEKLDEVALIRAARPMHLRIPVPDRLPDPLLRLDHAGVTVEGRVRLHPTTLRLRPDDRIGVLGANGAGKSTLLAVLAGLLPLTEGGRAVEPGLRVGYFAQHQREQLDDAASPLLHLQRLGGDSTEQELRNLLGGFGFSGTRVDLPVAGLSGGERVRLVLAMLVCQGPSVLLLDEPTNHLDLDMREALAEALEEYAGALVVVSHDRDLLARACDRFWRVRDGRVEDYDGDLDDYARELTRGAPASEIAASDGARTGDAGEREGGRERRQQAARQREALKPLRNAAEREEARCTRLQGELDALEEALADPGLYDQGDGGQLESLLQRQGQLRAELKAAEAAWLEVLEALENARMEA
ncbi:Glutathione-regulated potassium-efflux system ATP-binding protein [Thioalkalivibrio nitratireducens DSM 14787]|uniref:Probable ATP-binding protein YheS n=1 Tax=Thioalkalivibrio nitratireducens (strain DSM 14787 / UNIQEM 213 / ALEN2) TaxID=1255043 RepID=L0DUF0_THIND|nr:ATP-binding cassette domain-containing protein [Thioalkalivibrio nitratireducens]AGA31966.1 Glutathione-regulated potassium-efflux system ATP-binding protein [Thioalkalivibrio nitratireducens DSM 14787]